MPVFHNTLSHLHRRVGTYPAMKMEQTECSETLAYKIQTLGNYPEESIHHSGHGKSLKSHYTCGSWNMFLRLHHLQLTG